MMIPEILCNFAPYSELLHIDAGIPVMKTLPKTLKIFMSPSTYNSLMTNAKDYVMIVFGVVLYAIGFCGFILPHEVIIGGLAGVGALVYFATGGLIPVAVTQYACNLLLLAMAFKIVGKSFVLRTIFGATAAALSIGVFESLFMRLDHPLIADISMSVILGGILCGMGVGTAFIHNGSTGGTDIIAAMVSKVSNVSIGRTMIIVDMLIVATSILLPFEGTFVERLQVRVPLMVYGWVVTYVISYVTDMLINTNRQAKQFMIFSTNWSEIADRINMEAHRGVTVLDGEGWYSKKEIKILMVWCRKMESVTICRIIKSIDPDAFITQTNVNGVYGKGFDTMRVKMKGLKKT